MKIYRTCQAWPPCGGSLTVFALLALVLTPAFAADRTSIVTVGEMLTPVGIEVSPRDVRTVLTEQPEGQRALDTFRRYLSTNWGEIRDLDVIEMSRYHLEVTYGWQMPGAMPETDGRVIGRSAGREHLFLELRGPRLPARFDIVHRYLTFYARYAPATDSLDRVIATIRLEVFE